YVPAADVLFSGDTLFNGGPGATGRSFSDFDTIIESIKTKLLPLPAETKVLTGHGDSTAIGDEAPHLDEWIKRGYWCAGSGPQGSRSRGRGGSSRGPFFRALSVAFRVSVPQCRQPCPIPPGGIGSVVERGWKTCLNTKTSRPPRWAPSGQPSQFSTWTTRSLA